MAAIQPENMKSFLEKLDLPIVAHIRNDIQASGHTIDDVRDILVRSFTYELPADGQYRQFEPAGVGLYEITFTSNACVAHYWNRDGELLTYEQAKATLNLDLLDKMDRDHFNR